MRGVQGCEVLAFLLGLIGVIMTVVWMATPERESCLMFLPGFWPHTIRGTIVTSVFFLLAGTKS
jgi:hypothetical protein